MFNFKKNKSENCPISREMRLWLENSFLFLATKYGHETIQTKPQLLPTKEFFPIELNDLEGRLVEVGKILAKQMDIDFNELNIRIYKSGVKEFNTPGSGRLFLQNETQTAAGFYFGKGELKKFDIVIEEKNFLDINKLISTIAHELSHVKILGGEILKYNDEQLTDLNTVVLGVGIFTANTSFNFYKNSEYWGYSAMGYLTQQEWAYALALYALFRGEENPSWIKYLTQNLQSDFKKSDLYIQANLDKIFWENYDE